jgi:hypothetical protein
MDIAEGSLENLSISSEISACQVGIYLKIDASQPVKGLSRGKRKLKMGIPTRGAKLPQVKIVRTAALTAWEAG